MPVHMVDVSNLLAQPGDDLWLPAETYAGFGRPAKETLAVVVFSKEQALWAGSHYAIPIKFICVDFPRSLLATSVVECIRFFDEGKKDPDPCR